MKNIEFIENKLLELFKQYSIFLNSYKKDHLISNAIKVCEMNDKIYTFTYEITLPYFKIIYLIWSQFIDKLIANYELVNCLKFFDLIFNMKLYVITLEAYNKNEKRLSSDEKLLHYSLIDIELIKVTKYKNILEVSLNKLTTYEKSLLETKYAESINTIDYIYNDLIKNNANNPVCISNTNNLLKLHNFKK